MGFFFFCLLVKFRKVFNCSFVSSLCAHKAALGRHYVLQRRRAQRAVGEESFPKSGTATACSEWVTTCQYRYLQEQFPSHTGALTKPETPDPPQTLWPHTAPSLQRQSCVFTISDAVFSNQCSRQQPDSGTLSTKSKNFR